jgi:hypothetical protein
VDPTRVGIELDGRRVGQQLDGHLLLSRPLEVVFWVEPKSDFQLPT